MDATVRGEGVRAPWSSVPDHVVAAVSERLGAAVVGAVDRRGGFSPGPVAVLELADGRRAFAKAADEATSAIAAANHRREVANAAVVVGLPLPEGVVVPRPLGLVDVGAWLVALFEVAAGERPPLPWRAADLDRVAGATAALGGVVADGLPPVAAHAGAFSCWRAATGDRTPAALDGWGRTHLDRLAAIEAEADEAIAGTALTHLDVRADNVLLDGATCAFVDWSQACAAAPWLDLVLFAVPAHLQGGPPPGDLLAHLPAGRRPEPEALRAAVVAATGYFLLSSLQPPPPGLPTVRRFQALQAEVARRWAEDLTGLR